MARKETDILDQLLEIPRGIGGAYHDVIQNAAIEIERLRAGGCARDQRTTQFCAEAVALQREVERLRKELGQVSEADSWVSKTDAFHLDNLLNWCEFNAMDWHRALERLVNDRSRLRGEVNRLRELSGDAGQLREEASDER